MDVPEIRRILLQQAEAWQAAGVRFVPKGAGFQVPSLPPHPPLRDQAAPVEHIAPSSPEPNIMPPAKKPAAVPTAPLPPLKSSNEPWPTELAKLSVEQRQAQLDELRAVVAGCTLCAELARTRTQTVFGGGRADARICIFGEAPGADEDRLGQPFVGRSGKLLTQIIEACGFQREDVYILNTLKCRPPGNRNPTTQENANCRPYFERQLEIIQPEYIICLGRYAILNLLETQAPVGKLRGQFHYYRGSKVIVTYHPAYLLRNPSAKKDVWDDMKMMLKDMGLPIPKPNKN